MSAVRLDRRGELALQQQLQLLDLPPALKRRLINRTLQRLRAVFRGRVRQQSDLHGRAFKPRARRGSRKKMLTGLARHLTVTRLNPEAGTLGWSRARTAVIARAHNEGQTSQGNAQQLQRLNNLMGGRGATRAQARRLRQLGYRIRRPNGRSWQRAPLAWIEQNLGYAQAGLLIRILQDSPRKPSSWTIDTPRRAFFGVDDPRQVNQLISELIPQIIKR